MGWPGDSRAPSVCSQLKPSAWPNQEASVAGNRMMLLAKIGGITPDMLSLNGRWLDWPAYMRRPCMRLA